MKSFSRTHVSDHELLSSAVRNRGHEVTAFAEELADIADIAEIDARRLYLPAAHPSMYSWCVHALGLSDDEAYDRIRAARIARQFPVLFELLADGRLNLTGVCLLAPHITAGNAEGLLQAATRKTKRGIQQLIAERFPRSEVLTMVAERSTGATDKQCAVQSSDRKVSQIGKDPAPELGPDRVELQTRARPLSAESCELYLCIRRQTHENLLYALALASHQVRHGDVAEAFDRALKAWIRELEKTRFAATERPRSGRRPKSSIGRLVPAAVKRAVWERDGGRCTFATEGGHRCPATSLLQFDHIDPVARGGNAVAENIRLRCRAHNQFEAERAFGAEFMKKKRAAAMDARAETRTRKIQAAAAGCEGIDPGIGSAVDRQPADHDLQTGLRQLGYRSDDVRRALVHCSAMADATLEEKLRAALRMLAPRAVRHDFRPAATAVA